MGEFKLIAPYKPTGDQPKAISQLVGGLNENKKHQILLGVTGSGKTYTMANIIAQVQRPALILAHNKTLAAQLCSEFQEFFPHNAVHYFVSYYDYYQPEAYLPRTDTYIEKDATLNEEIDRLRHAATSALFQRRDVIIVASVSCIYGLGSPKDYQEMTLELKRGESRSQEKILKRLVEIHYQRNDIGFQRSTFRVRGDSIDIIPAYSEQAIRIEQFGDEVERLCQVDALTGEVLGEMDQLTIYPGTHYITNEDQLKKAIEKIAEELEERLKYFKEKGQLLEAQRLEQRTRYDLEMLMQLGFCTGIENYSRFLTGREPGAAPATLFDYFPKDFLLFVDESHVAIPQVRAMYAGDRSRKETLVNHGFRLPSAFDNRPLIFDEFEKLIGQAIYVSATPAAYELEHQEQIVEQIIRPTGLLDPEVEVRPVKGQVDDLLGEIRKRIVAKERVLVTTLTKKMSEDLTDYLGELGIKVQYLHSEVETLERIEILRDLRLGVFDVLVGINLLREGLDLPEVTLVAILDADKEGFLRSATALIQTIGRTARNVNGRVIMYGDVITKSMAKAIDETERRRKIQIEYNQQHGITPQSIIKEIKGITDQFREEEATAQLPLLSVNEALQKIKELEKKMQQAAQELEFEKAAAMRDELAQLRKMVV